jgi:glutamyl-Q tRNA(Asp) synthetase
MAFLAPDRALNAPYIGRFAPSPTGPLHAGSLVAALASWLDAKSRGGRWLLRLEDIDRQRCRPETAALICAQLAALGLHWDGPVLLQTSRTAAHEQALEQLQRAGHVYGCVCTRSQIAALSPPLGASGEPVYPGTCARRTDIAPDDVRAWRLRVGDERIAFVDRRCGPQRQDLPRECGDYVVKRADGPFAYHLACVVDDAGSGVTDVVRGEDLLPLTARQIHLQRLLGLPALRYLHVPLVLNAAGEKLSKQTGAPAIDPAQPVQALQAAAQALGLGSSYATTVDDLLVQSIARWTEKFLVGGESAAGHV